MSATLFGHTGAEDTGVLWPIWEALKSAVWVAKGSSALRSCSDGGAVGS